jgi:hypothetical protein
MHSDITCLVCATETRICTGRKDDLAAYHRATVGFRSAGWELLPDPERRPDYGPYGDHPWRCPVCVAAGATAKGPHTVRWGQGRGSLPGTHTRIICDACGKASADVCGKRDEVSVARANAVASFEAQYWRCDPGRRGHAPRWAGDGKWYCPACASVPHM